MVVPTVIPMVVVAAVAAVPAGAPAGAAPPGPPPPPPPCSFSLSPQSDGTAVIATVRSTGCAALAEPYAAVVCLQAGDAAPSCAQARGAAPAQVSLPYRPGSAYTASGRGCARWVTLDPAADCQLLGPTTWSP